MFLAAARALADTLQPSDLEQGALYSRLRDIRRVSLAFATQVAEAAYDEGIATRSRPESISDDLAAQMYMPNY